MRIIYFIFIFSFIMGGLIENTAFGQRETRRVVENPEDLRDSIRTAVHGDTLVLSRNFEEIEDCIFLSVVVGKNIVFDGNNMELKVTNNSRYFDFLIGPSTGGMSFVLQNMTFKGTDAGGGVSIKGGMTGGHPIVVFKNTRFVSIKGSALYYAKDRPDYNGFPTIKLINSIFENNHTTETSGGAVYLQDECNLYVDNCAFIGNRSLKTDGSGGAICLSGTTGSCDISYSIFRKNEASEHGGAISVYNALVTELYIHSCLFEENKAVKEGNISADGGAISVFGSDSTYNANIEILKSTFYKNEAEDDAGAVFIQNTGVNAGNSISNCVFFENVAKDAIPKKLGSNDTGTAGGAIQLSVNSSLKLKNNTIAGNYTHKKPGDETTQGGGGIGYYYHKSYGCGNVLLENNIILDNYTLVMPDSTIIKGPYANVGFHENYGGPSIAHSANIGYDAMLNAEWCNPENILGKNPVLWENLGDKIEYPRYAGLKDENAPAEYRQIVPSLSILPHINDSVGIANEGCQTDVYLDIRGYGRKEGDRQDVGAVEIVWARFDANGGAWRDLPDLSSYKGTAYYEKDASGNVEYYYQITYYNGEVVKPPYPVRDGYIFNGWEFVPSGDIWDGLPYTTDGNDSLKALWVECPPTSTWNTGAVDNDWNNPANWSDGVPGKCTRVTISAEAGYYPVITDETSPEAQCKTIHFEFGGEVAGTPFLDYDSAYVDLTLNPNRWYMLSAPLRDMYSGDYFLSAKRKNPSVSMMQYQKDNPQYSSVIIKEQGKWSKTFNTLRVPLDAADGYALKINSDVADSLYTFTFPRYETFYIYYDENGDVAKSTYDDPPGGPMERTNNGRFIYETALNYETGTFKLPVDSAYLKYDNLIIGNPFMAHLDLLKFCVANTKCLTGSFLLWTNNNLVEYAKIIGDRIVSTSVLKDSIAPMQSFFAECSIGQLDSLVFSSDMTIIDPSTKLRSASSPFDGLLHIEASRDGQRQSGAAIVYMKEAGNNYEIGKDAKAFFISGLGNKPAVIYSAVDGQALAIHTVGDLSQNIELGISTSIVGDLTLDFSGMDSFDPNDKIEFVDRQLGEVLDLNEAASYTFRNETGDIEGRFYLRVSESTTQTDDLSSEKDILIYAQSGVLYLSAPDEILRVEVFNLQGQSIYQRTATGKTRLEVPLALKGQPAIVKVQTGTSAKIQKVFVGQ